MMNDEHLHFACGWAIQPDVNFTRLKTYANEIGCELRLVPPMYVSEQGFTVLTFAVRVDEEPKLIEFIKKAGVEMGLTHWYGVPADYYARGTDFDIDSEPVNVRVEWLKVMNAYGRKNDELRQQMNDSNSIDENKS